MKLVIFYIAALAVVAVVMLLSAVAAAFVAGLLERVVFGMEGLSAVW